MTDFDPRRIDIVITFREGEDPDPMPVRDHAGRVRIYDEATDRYGWAELTNVVVEGPRT